MSRREDDEDSDGRRRQNVREVPSSGGKPADAGSADGPVGGWPSEACAG